MTLWSLSPVREKPFKRRDLKRVYIMRVLRQPEMCLRAQNHLSGNANLERIMSFTGLNCDPA